MYTEKWSYDWKGIRPQIKDSIIELDKYGELTSKSVGVAGITPQQWHRQNWIIENSKESELLKLTDFPSGTVKGIAYEGLLKKDYLKQYDLFKKVLNDTLTFVHYQSGCFSNGFMLSDYIISYKTIIENPELNQNPININLTDSEKKEIIKLMKKRKEKEGFYKEEYLKRLK
ncbi:hypothetical protein EC396_11225 [Lutibacter sp. HS1-25]|nr:hypothetical protein EC396_11225 [Lutibacter sp. HS1-25]